MTYDEIFTAYYTLFRADSDVPTSTDDEYTVGLRLANEAVNYWANFDGTYWKELFTTNQINGTGTQTITTGTQAYTLPSNYREIGGFATVKDSNGKVVQKYPIIDAHEVQFKGDDAIYCYVTGDPVAGNQLNLNPAPPSSLNGLDIDYWYYKKPTTFTTGTDTTEVPDPYFIVHRMLAQQFRAARNPYYSSALRDSESAVKTMQIDNNSGSWANPWQLADTAGSAWGM